VPPKAPASKPILALINRQVVYEWSNDVVWQVPVEQIAVIGEYTDPNGPYVDDYFLVFLTKTARRHIASFYSDGRDTCLADLGSVLGSTVECGLCNSTDYKSRIMWPPSLQGKDLFDFVPLKRETLLGRIIQRIVPSFEMKLTTAVESHLRHEREPV